MNKEDTWFMISLGLIATIVLSLMIIPDNLLSYKRVEIDREIQLDRNAKMLEAVKLWVGHE